MDLMIEQFSFPFWLNDRAIQFSIMAYWPNNSVFHFGLLTEQFSFPLWLNDRALPFSAAAAKAERLHVTVFI